MNPVNALGTSFSMTNKAICNSKIDSELSGSTCITAIICGNKLYCGNVGDSRAIICSTGPNSEIIGRQLTRDHKPNDNGEARRIIERGGRIAASEGNILI